MDLTYNVSMQVVSLVLAVFAVIIILALWFEQGRMTRAMRNLEKDARHYMVRDLSMKRTEVAAKVSADKVEDPERWLAACVGQVSGTVPAVQVVKTWKSEQDGRVCGIVLDSEDFTRYLFTPVEPRKLFPLLKAKSGTLSSSDTVLLGRKPEKLPVYELNIVTVSEFFDMQASVVWQHYFGVSLPTDYLYLYEYADKK